MLYATPATSRGRSLVNYFPHRCRSTSGVVAEYEQQSSRRQRRRGTQCDPHHRHTDIAITLSRCHITVATTYYRHHTFCSRYDHPEVYTFHSYCDNSMIYSFHLWPDHPVVYTFHSSFDHPESHTSHLSIPAISSPAAPSYVSSPAIATRMTTFYLSRPAIAPCATITYISGSATIFNFGIFITHDVLPFGGTTNITQPIR